MLGQFDVIVNEITGLNPLAFLVLGNGFVREEWKSLCFSRGKSITKLAISNPKQIALLLVPEADARLLDRSARIELLRQSFKDESLKEALPTLMNHRFRPKFFESLERALTRGRAFFAHNEEGQVLEERLLERCGQDPRREEFFLLNQFWCRLLEVRELWDEARLFEIAAGRVRTGEKSLPVLKLYRMIHFEDSPRIEFFWQELARKIEVHPLKSEDLFSKKEFPLSLERHVSHTLEDAAHFLMDELLTHGIDASAVVIEDVPEVRRTLRRVAAERGVPLYDSRDPTQAAQSEELKSALLELELVARNFPSALVLTWVTAKFKNAGEIRKKIIESGIVQGFENYRIVPELYSALSRLKEAYPSRISIMELSEKVKSSLSELHFEPWVTQTMDRLISDHAQSLRQIGLQERKRPLRFWLEEIQQKLKSAPPMISPEKRESGLRLYRVDQAVTLDTFAEGLRFHFFGIRSSFFDANESASEWFSARDTEVLSREFSIPGRETKIRESRRSFVAWASRSDKTPWFWEYSYNEEGAEMETLELLLQSIAEIRVQDTKNYSVHPRVLPSLRSRLAAPETHVKIQLERREFPMSFLTSLGNCAFTAYAQHLLALYDERDPDFDLSGDSFGNLVHTAVEHLILSELKTTPQDAFEFAWRETAKLAWLKSDRLFRAIRAKCISILEGFILSEQEYRSRSQAQVIGQEIQIELKRGEFTFKGRLDRIDQHADGIVLMDYKTGSSLPSGSETLEKLRGLQLPAYALAVKEKWNQEVVSAQYVQLHAQKTNRNLGFLFSRWNKGKKADTVEFPLSTARSISGSLISKDPHEVWAEIDQKITALLEFVQKGEFIAKPADPKDCDKCRYSVVCGFGRRAGEVVAVDEA